MYRVVAPPHAGRDAAKLPSKLETPTFPQVKPERVTIAQPAYEGLSPKQVRSGWSHMGYKVLGMYRKIYLDPPKPGLPDGYNLLVTDNGLANSATHILAVYPYAPPSTYGPAARRHKSFGFRREVCLYPTHAAIWAAYCSRLPEMPKKPSKLKIIADSRQATQRAFVLRLPMVPIALPCPPMFLPIMQFVYMYRRGRFVNALLPCSDFMLPPDHQLDPLPQEAIPQYAQALAATSDLPKLCRYAKNVHGAYRNMVALGVVEERMWEALHYAWETILTAMDLAEKAQEAS
ncbi:hypothetical protein BD414DRAFT_514856 [Trametes punicea]|nr:hypothetical protein BD414DRAFT_514856 [Trametes punicea]